VKSAHASKEVTNKDSKHIRLRLPHVFSKVRSKLDNTFTRIGVTIDGVWIGESIY
jgi:hypothetical protein